MLPLSDDGGGGRGYLAVDHVYLYLGSADYVDAATMLMLRDSVVLLLGNRTRSSGMLLKRHTLGHRTCASEAPERAVC